MRLRLRHRLALLACIASLPAVPALAASDGHAGHGAAGGATLPAICLAGAQPAAATPAGRHGEAPAGALPGPGQQAMAQGMDAMHGDMMRALQHPDVDVAFVCGMIPHHEGALVMARAQLAHGKDEWVRQLAREVIAAQEREIRDMREWLDKRSGASASHAH